MAIVNIDLSEYDSLRNRKKELEEQVKELKKQVENLKSGSKVIIRTVEQVEHDKRYHDFLGSEKPTKVVSESYVGFEDVRIKVEEAMKEQIDFSIYERNKEAEEYRKKREDLKAIMEKNFEERYEGKVSFFKNMADSYEKNDKNYERAFKRIEQLSGCVLEDLCGRLFKPSSAIRLVETIKVVSAKKNPDATVDDSGLKY